MAWRRLSHTRLLLQTPRLLQGVNGRLELSLLNMLRILLHDVPSGKTPFQGWDAWVAAQWGLSPHSYRLPPSISTTSLQYPSSQVPLHKNRPFSAFSGIASLTHAHGFNYSPTYPSSAQVHPIPCARSGHSSRWQTTSQQMVIHLNQ